MAGSEAKTANTRESKRLRNAGPPQRLEAGGISKMDLVKKAKGKDVKKAEKPANEWTVAEVSKWISSFAFGKQYKAAFEEHEIAGDTLRDIDDAILNDELGIENARHRKRLLAEINDVLRKAGAGGPSADGDDDSDSDDDSSDSSSSDEETDDMNDEPESKKAPKSKPKSDAFNFPSDDEEEKRSDATSAKKSNSVKKRKDTSSSSQSSTASKKKAPKKVARRQVKSKPQANGNGTTVAKKAKKKVGLKGKASLRRGKGGGRAAKAAMAVTSNGEPVPKGKMVCPPCGAVIDKDCAMCMECFAVFPEKKGKQFASTSYYRAYRAVPNYRS